MLLNKAEVDASQRIYILSSAATNIDERDVKVDSANDQYIVAVTYSSIVSILRQCGKSKNNSPKNHINVSLTTVTASIGKTTGRGGARNGGRKQIITSELLAD